jgi:SAM-dependent methyltransferase
VADLEARLGALTVERRRLLERLAAGPDEPRLAADGAFAARDDGVAGFYDAVTASIDATAAGPYAYFLNYGYADGDDDRAVVPLPERTLDRSSVKLALELVGDCPLGGRRVLDVGCGRGGTVRALLAHFAPAAVVGVDLAPGAIAFCRRTHLDPRATFSVADAQALPFDDGAFDVVTNVESSHCYRDVVAFYHEVRRVLVRGGVLLYTDLLATASLPVRLAALAREALVLELERDVTANVLAACDLVAARRRAAFAPADRAALADFLAVPGSAPYESMRSGASTYVIWRLRAR